EAETGMAAANPVTYRDVERARLILVVGLDAENELPILHLRIRKASRRGAKVFVIHPRRTRLWDVAEHRSCLPGEEAATATSLRPGGRRVEEDDERAAVEVGWGTLLPHEPGRDAARILEAAAHREIEVLFLVGVDPLRDFPDATLARRALENAPFKVVVDASA